MTTVKIHIYDYEWTLCIIKFRISLGSKSMENTSVCHF